jgi:magnesium chelatase family protein
LGELALDGMIRPIKGALSMAIAARDIGVKGIFLPAENASEAAVVDGIPIFPVEILSWVISALKGAVKVCPVPSEINHFMVEDSACGFLKTFLSEYGFRTIHY